MVENSSGVMGSGNKNEEMNSIWLMLLKKMMLHDTHRFYYHIFVYWCFYIHVFTALGVSEHTL